jgi:hypothetical protein
MDRIDHYLHTPAGYAPFLDGLHWSVDGQAIEYPDGEPFVLAPELALFLEGLTAGRGPIHFGFVLHLLALLGIGKATVCAAGLAHAFRQAGRPLRNAGALAAVLCRKVPVVPEPPEAERLCCRLASPTLMAQFALDRLWGLGGDVPDGVPPWSAAGFEAVVLQELVGLYPEELAHWLRHGRGPLDRAGDRVARALPAGRPRTLAHVLAGLARQRRVAGAVPFVAQLTGALALPPRRLAHHELPMGGYADVTTRGHPEQLLPSQFVLEDPPAAGGTAPAGALSLEFIRRYAENELLYFRREEPHAQLREELVLLLDQGVRTWGDVRLVLTAAVLALGRWAERRRLPLWLAGSSSEGRLLDPLAVGPEELARLVEASDLSPHPGLALERVLEERSAAPASAVPTDVVLLTHPRSLAEPDVAAAAHRVRPGMRLFAVAVDGHGRVLLARMEHGSPVKVSQFRVDLSPRPEPPAPPAPVTAYASWRGDVEPVPFPFRFGVTAPAATQLFAFDHAGEWVLRASHNGPLHAWRSDGSAVEVLPRGYIQGAVLTNVEAVRGVVGGFVVAGWMAGELTVVHYDFAHRLCRAHRLGAEDYGRRQWFYFPDLNCLTAVSTLEQGDRSVTGLDLATGTGGEEPKAGTRLAQAFQRTRDGRAPSPFVPIVDESQTAPAAAPYLRFDREAGRLTLGSMEPPWEPFVPRSEGRPVLRGARLLFAKLTGDVLAVDCYYPEGGGRRVLRLFRGPDGVVLGELVGPPRLVPGFIALSHDGRLLAREVSRTEVEVRALDEGLRLVAATPRGKCHHDLDLTLGEMHLTLQAGRSVHLLCWDRGVLDCSFTTGDAEQFLRRHLGGTTLSPAGVRATADGLPAFVRYDPQRFRAGAHHVLIAVADVFGQVALFERTGELVAMFFAFRGQVAAWLPDGTRLGPAGLVGGPPTPDAARRIGAALHTAWQQNEETA